jgi:GntR family transcriptional regulator, carbon starvation induced regulator
MNVERTFKSRGAGERAMKHSVAGEPLPAHGEGANTIAETVYQRIRDDVVWGNLKPGVPLRSDALRTRYGVGISPLREALTRLASERLVIAVGYRGFSVAPMTAYDVQDTKVARLVIEREALALSIRAGALDWETALVAAYHALSRTAIPTKPGPASTLWATLHRRFHMALLSACGSRWLIELAGQFFDQAERHRLLRARLSPYESLTRDINKEHERIFDAALSRDVNAAVQALEAHYESTANWVTTALSHGKTRSKGKTGPPTSAIRPSLRQPLIGDPRASKNRLDKRHPAR